jgi:hypothetical protein
MTPPFRGFIVQTLLLSSFFFLMINFSCSNSQQSEVRQIDSLIDVSENLILSIDSLQIDSLKDIMKKAGESLELLQSYTPDTVSKPTYLTYLSIYGDIHKAMSRGLPAVESHRKSLMETVQQLANLKHDIKKNLIPDSVARDYLNAEKQILNQIKSESDVVLTNIRLKQDFYRKLHAQVDSFIHITFK